MKGDLYVYLVSRLSWIPRHKWLDSLANSSEPSLLLREVMDIICIKLKTANEMLSCDLP